MPILAATINALFRPIEAKLGHARAQILQRKYFPTEKVAQIASVIQDNPQHIIKQPIEKAVRNIMAGSFVKAKEGTGAAAGTGRILPRGLETQPTQHQKNPVTRMQVNPEVPRAQL